MKHHFVYEIAKEINSSVGNNKDELWTVLNILESIVNVSPLESATTYMLTVASQILCFLSCADTTEELEEYLEQFKKFLEM